MLARPINPFILGGPVPASKFVGRRKEVLTIVSQLANPSARGSSAISGGPRIGKTSLLEYISDSEIAGQYGLTSDRYVFVRIDSQNLGKYTQDQGLQTLTDDAFWHYILRSLIADRIYETELTRKLHDQDRINVFDLNHLFDEAASENKLVVLLLDEFDWIIAHTDHQQPSLLYTLRALLNRPVSERGLALVTSSEERLDILCEDIKFAGSPFYNTLLPVNLGPFSEAEVDELVDKYLEGAGITFEEYREFILSLSGGHPCWVQRVCFELFNRYQEHPGVLSEADRRAIASEIKAEIAAGREEPEAATEKRAGPERIHFIIIAMKRLLAKFRTAIVFLLLALLLCWLIPDFSDWFQAEVLGKVNETPIVGLYNSRGEEIQATIYSPRLLRVGTSGTIQIVSHDPEKPDINVIPQPSSGIVAIRDKDDPGKFTIECKDTSTGIIPRCWAERRQLKIAATMPITGSLPVTTTIFVKTHYVFSFIAKLILLIGSSVFASLATLAGGIKKIPAFIKGSVDSMQGTSQKESR